MVIIAMGANALNAPVRTPQGDLRWTSLTLAFLGKTATFDVIIKGMRYRLTLYGPAHLPDDEGKWECWAVVSSLTDLASLFGPEPEIDVRVDHECLLIVDLVGITRYQKEIIHHTIKSAEDVHWADHSHPSIKVFIYIYISVKRFIQGLLIQKYKNQ